MEWRCFVSLGRAKQRHGETLDIILRLGGSAFPLRQKVSLTLVRIRRRPAVQAREVDGFSARVAVSQFLAILRGFVGL
jgi:hypothetical protein